MHESYPKNIEFQNGLAISCIYLSSCFEEKDLSKALNYLKQAEDLYDRLVELAPQYQAFQQNRDWVKDKIKGRESC